MRRVSSDKPTSFLLWLSSRSRNFATKTVPNQANQQSIIFFRQLTDSFDIASNRFGSRHPARCIGGSREVHDVLHSIAALDQIPHKFVPGGSNSGELLPKLISGGLNCHDNSQPTWPA
jgi:hypothetical protein